MTYNVLTALPATAVEYINAKEQMKQNLKEIGTIVRLDRKPIVIAQVRQLETRYGWVCKIYNDTADPKVMYVQHTANVPITEQQKADNTIPPETPPANGDKGDKGPQTQQRTEPTKDQRHKGR